MSNRDAELRSKKRVGLVVAFAALGDEERHAVEIAWNHAIASAVNWTPAFAAFGLESITDRACASDILVYLGESSRFERVAGEASQRVPVVLVKSTVEELLHRESGSPPRYRMCTGVTGIAKALASVAPLAPTVDWQTLPWPRDVMGLLHLDNAEQSYVDISVAAFRSAAEGRGIRWQRRLPNGGQTFSVFLTMHDPSAAMLAQTALRLWPQCTVLAADGMVATRAPGGEKWPERMLRVRHWSPRSHSTSNRLFREAVRGKRLPDYDSAGMVFGALCFLDRAFATGVLPEELHFAGRHAGPLGLMRMTLSGQPQPERLVVFQGDRMKVITVG